MNSFLVRWLLLGLVACGSKWTPCDTANDFCGDDESWYDSDADGYVDVYGYYGDDCDDANAAVNPGAAIGCDGTLFDANCDGIEDVTQCDVDGDGFTTVDGDCNDGDRDSNPGAVEFCGDGVNQDCDEFPDDRTDPSCTGDTGTSPSDTGSEDSGA